MSEVVAAEKYGTFKGVFLPTLLAVFGVILFLRLGWMVGNVGIHTTLIIILLAFFVAGLTALSISATVSNMRVGGGGAYYIISRSLGIEVGAALGLLLFLAQAIGISFYLNGFAESFSILFPVVPEKIVSITALFFLGALGYFSAGFLVRAQSFIFAAILIGIASFYFGSSHLPPVDSSAVAKTAGFWEVFAVFFPAITGIIAGIGLSGSLKDPSKSLPRGLLLSLSFAGVVFLALPILLYMRVDAVTLTSNMLIMADLSYSKPLLVLGLWAAALSSAVSAFLSAPRLMQALAIDHVIPYRLSKGFKAGDDEPKFAIVFTFLIALVAVLLGDLNAIAPILTMIYLTAFATINFSTGIETLIGAPSWRPQFQVPASLSLFAALIAVLIMIMINAGAGICAIFSTIFIYYVMLRRRINTNWGDARQGILMLLARHIIHRLQENKPSPYSWKPNFLVMVPGPNTGWPLIEFANHLSQNSGFITAATALSIDTSQERIRALEEAMRKHLQDKDIVSLVRIYQGASWYQVAERLILFYGIGRIVPDTLVIGTPQLDSINADLYRLIKFAHVQHRNILLLNQTLKDIDERKAKKKIMVWWGGKRHNGSLMIALGSLLQRSTYWDDSTITLCSVVENVRQQDEVKFRLNEFAERSRISVDIDVVCNPENAPLLQVIAERSMDADITFIGVRPPGADETELEYMNYLRNFFGGLIQLKSVCFVMAGDEVRLSRIFT